MNGAAKWTALLFQLNLCSFAALSQGTTPPNPWHVLNAATHDTTYIFLEVNGVCTAGKIVSVNENFVRVMPDSRNQPDASKLRKSERKNIVRITDFLDDIHHIVYRGRSSWSDVRELQPQGRFVCLSITTRNRRTTRG